MSQEVMEALQDTYKEKVFPAIRLDTKIKQASSANQTIFEVDNKAVARKIITKYARYY